MADQGHGMSAEETLALLRESEALLEGHFELSSGLHSDRYFQCARVLMHPDRAERLARALAARIDEEVDVVVGPAMGAVTWAHEVARAMGVRGMFTERKDGSMCLRRGFTIEPGERVLLVEDVVTTGKSAKEVVDVLRSFGARIVGVGSIVNRSGGNPFAELGLELVALADVQVRTWDPGDPPAEFAGGEAVKPGSRPGGGSA